MKIGHAVLASKCLCTISGAELNAVELHAHWHIAVLLYMIMLSAPGPDRIYSDIFSTRSYTLPIIFCIEVRTSAFHY